MYSYSTLNSLVNSYVLYCCVCVREGGLGQGVLAEALVREELSFGCSGISTAILASGMGVRASSPTLCASSSPSAISYLIEGLLKCFFRLEERPARITVFSEVVHCGPVQVPRVRLFSPPSRLLVSELN